MARSLPNAIAAPPPAPRDALELLKPITWFPPMWAFACGAVSAGAPIAERWPVVLGGVVLAGPLVCGTSQAVNDWFDRHVDAINQPERPIPSGRVAGRWGLWIACLGSALSLLVAAALGVWVLAATMIGLVLAWAYSAPPWRLKASGWWGPAACAFCYEGLTWFTGAAVVSGGLPRPDILALLLLYSAGAHGIMVLNDFKAIVGDRATGVRSLPATLGVTRAARLACVTMAVPQMAVIALLAGRGLGWHAAAITALLAGQFVAMRRLLADPARHAPWYNATGVAMFVSGMMIAAFGVGSLA